MKKYFPVLLIFVFSVCGCTATPGKCLLASCPDNGHVVYQHRDGTVYDGQAISGLAYGKGKLNYPNGWYAEGNFVAGKMAGQGTLWNSSGVKYVGSWSENTMHGQGVLTIPGGTKHDFSVFGKGVFVFCPQDVRLTGIWNGGELHSGRIEWSDGRVYEGRMNNFKRFGQGTTTYADGSTVCGEWNDAAPVLLYTPEQFRVIKPVKTCSE